MRQILIMILFFSCYTLFAEDVSFTVSAPGSVQVGQQFRLVYSLNAKPKNYYEPDLRNFRILSGPTQSSSSSIQIVNGKMTQSHSYTYTYILQAIEEGEFTIQPAKVVIDKKEYLTEAVKIKVIKGQAQQQPGQSQGGQPRSQQQAQTSDANNVYAIIHVNKTNVFQGEAIYATVKFYSKYEVVDYGDPKMPNFEGFLIEDIGEVKPSFKTEVINGQYYVTVLFKNALLIPQITGEIIIEPFEWEVVYQKRVSNRPRSIWDDFFGSYKNYKIAVKSKPVKINVKSLPANKPIDFSGAVGTFSLKTSIDKNQIKANDAINLKAIISGSGNIKLINAPKINFPADFEIYDPKINLNTQATASGVSGTKTFEYLIIPRHAGEYTIPQFSFSYFDIISKQYKTLKSNEFKISVEKASEEDQSAVVVSGLSKEDIKFFGQDIRFIKAGEVKFKPIGAFIFGTVNFYLTYLISFILFILIVIIWKNQIKQNANIQKLKNRKANKLARKRLKIAHKYLKENNKDLFYEEVIKAIWGYLCDKLTIPLSKLSKENTIETLTNKSIPEDDMKSIKELIDNCEFARYAPSSEDTAMDTIYSNAVKLISKLENKL